MENEEHLLTFELEQDGEQLFIHGDPTGLRLLARSISRLAERAEVGEPDHDHLFTEAWGGWELSAKAQSPQSESRLLNHVKVFGWPSPAGCEPYRDP